VVPEKTDLDRTSQSAVQKMVAEALLRGYEN